MKFYKKFAVLVLTALVGSTIAVSGASAATVSVSVTGAASGAGTSASPAVISVPSDDAISGDVLTIEVTVDSASTVTNITTTGGARVIRSYDGTTKSNAGVSSLSIVPTGTTYTIYAYTTSTTTASIVFSVTGQTTTYYVKGSAGPAYKVALSVPTAGTTSGTVTAVANVSDVFGNPVATAPTFTVINGAAAAATTTVVGEYKSVITLPAASGTTALEVNITAATAIAGLDAPVSKSVAFVTVSDLAAINAALTAEVASLKSQLTESASKLTEAGSQLTEALAAKKVADDSLVLAQANIAAQAKRIANLEKKVKKLKAAK